MAEKKITKKERFEELKGIVKAAQVEQETKDALVEFIDTQVALLDKRAASVKARADKAKAEGDELRATIFALVTDEFQSADAITAQVGAEDVTKAKVVSRLSQLVEAGKVVKETLKDEESKRKIVHYKLAEVSADEVDAEPVEEAEEA